MRFQKLLTMVLALYVVVGCWKGYVAIFQEGEAEPWQIFPCQVTSLPTADQQALAEGIVIRNERDLRQLLEDFLS